MTWMEAAQVALIGLGATALMDIWTLVLKRLGIATLDYALVGRWAGHLARGKFTHASIGQSTTIAGERPLGWAIHYAVGIVFAGLVVVVAGWPWLRAPSLLPALVVGIATVAVPLFIMQPAMGAGFMASKTPTPFKNCLRSLATHTVFGFGLHLAATLIALCEA